MGDEAKKPVPLVIAAVLWLRANNVSAAAARVLVDLVEHCDKKGVAFPSVDRLAANGWMNKRTAQRALAELVQHPEAPIAQRRRGYHATAEYVTTDQLRKTREELLRRVETRQGRHDRAVTSLETRQERRTDTTPMTRRHDNRVVAYKEELTQELTQELTSSSSSSDDLDRQTLITEGDALVAEISTATKTTPRAVLRKASTVPGSGAYLTTLHGRKTSLEYIARTVDALRDEATGLRLSREHDEGDPARLVRSEADAGIVHDIPTLILEFAEWHVANHADKTPGETIRLWGKLRSIPEHVWLPVLHRSSAAIRDALRPPASSEAARGRKAGMVAMIEGGLRPTARAAARERAAMAGIQGGHLPTTSKIIEGLRRGGRR